MSQSDFDDLQSLELLAGHVLDDLSDEEFERVEEILNSSDSASDVHWELEKTIAGVQLALLSTNEAELPDPVADRIRSEGRRMVGQSTELRSSAPVDSVSVASTDQKSNSREWIAWLCAAAAMLVALSMWQSGRRPGVTTAVRARAELLQESESVLRVDWTVGKTPFDQSVTGDVVWDAVSQTGFMRFVDMPINDPTVEQYQLWIIDPERDEEPIDGGVFDITESGEVIVPIDAKLRVIDPAAFAITIEKPGGVVVSTQERLPLLAAVAG